VLEFLSSVVNLGRKISSFKSSPQFDGYTSVVIIVSDDLEYSAGTDTGRTLTVNNPWGTQEMAENILKKIGAEKPNGAIAKKDLIKRGLTIKDIIEEFGGFNGIPYEILFSAETEVKYEGYLHKALDQIEKSKRLEERLLPTDIDYLSITGLRLEARQKLDKIRPTSLGQAGRISGVSPADIAVLMVYLSK
jgi:tRNA uridine 5-carboxymethylaminomethyl modification enzyme